MVETSAASQLALEAQESAIEEVSRLLQHPEDLLRLPTLRAEYSQKERVNNAQLTALLQSHVESVLSALELLEKAQKSVLKLRACFEQIDALCAECSSLIQHHEKIQLLSVAHRNIVKTLEEIDDIIDLPSNAGVAEEMLNDDNTLLEAFKTLTVLQGTSTIVQDARKGEQGYSDEMKNLKEYFDKVNDSIKKFEDKLWRLFSQYDLLAQKNPGLLVACIQVVEIQEAIDVQMAKAPKNYKRKALEKMEEKVKEKFKSVKEDCQIIKINEDSEEQTDNSEVIQRILEKASDLANQLPQVYDFVSPCFPPRYRIFHLFWSWYHAEFINMIGLVAARVEGLSNKEILDLIAWTEFYFEILRGLGIEEEELKFYHTAALDPSSPRQQAADQEAVLGLDLLFDKYMERNKQSTTTWFLNILESDLAGEPKFDNERKLWTPGYIDFFRILNDGIYAIEQVTTAQMLYKCACSSLEMMIEFVKAQILIMERPLPLEMLCAIANNNIRSYDMAIEFLEHFEDMANESYKHKLDVDTVCRGFLDTAKTAMIKITDNIYTDPGMVELLKKLYHTQEWKKGVVMTTFIATLEDYFQDLKDFLDSGVFKRVVETALKAAMQTLVETLVSKMPAIKDDVVARMQEDEKDLRNFFVPYSTSERVEQHLQSLTNFRCLACSDSTEAFVLSYSTVLDIKPDTPPAVVEKICAARKDISRQDATEIVEQCKELYIQRQRIMKKENFNKEQLEVTEGVGTSQVTNIWNRIWNRWQDE